MKIETITTIYKKLVEHITVSINATVAITFEVVVEVDDIVDDSPEITIVPLMEGDKKCWADLTSEQQDEAISVISQKYNV